MIDQSAEAIRVQLVEALWGCRFALHCALLGYRGRDDQEGIEITAEALGDAQVALVRACAPEPPPPICSGCSPIQPFEDEATVAAWRALHPERYASCRVAEGVR